ncbi:MAG: hypothetical protein OEZ23_10050 [Gammaproteobacteria bacterium]|nr:hypothetical protein [Gammaproteobacteria bacterium]
MSDRRETRWKRRGGVYLLTLLSLCWLTGCTTLVVVEGSIPEPQLETLAYKVGVYYAEAFSTQYYEESIPQGGDWKVDFSEYNQQMTQSILDHVFRETVLSGPPDRQSLPGDQVVQVAGQVDGYVAPVITQYAFLVPSTSGLQFFSASIHYELWLYDREGRLITTWKTVGYGKSEVSSLTPGQSLAAATLEAIRDGTARMGIALTRNSDQNREINRWLTLMAANSSGS